MHSNVVVMVLAVIGAASALKVRRQYQHELQGHLQHVQVQPKSPPIPILKQSYEQSKDGYQFSYETGNGIHVEEAGYIKNRGDKKNEILVQKGSVTYKDEHGHPITLTYVADEHGFQPQGSHLPTPPPIPEAIQKSLHENALQEQQQQGYQQQEYQQVEYQQQQQQSEEEQGGYDLQQYAHYQ